MAKQYLLLMMIIFFTSFGIKANQEVKINNEGFEAGNSIPQAWTTTNSNTTKLDLSVKFKGKSSVKITHENLDETTISSEPVSLVIGHLYKVSAYIKTENVYSDPLAKYPTSVGGCITMESLPFTNHSQTVGATHDWQLIENYFIASNDEDRVRLHLGYNGKAKGTIWFDEVKLEKVDDITEYIPYETVKWFGDAYRYDDRGWIFVHIEGEPYDRGYQYGYLVANEMVEYINKLAIEEVEDDPRTGWNEIRFVADAFMLRKYETEYLKEMKGIAAGANYAGIKLFGRELDLIDIVALNSAIDIDAAKGAMRNTANPLSGINFFSVEDEFKIPEKFHKCSAFLANKSATKDGRVVFGQIFMWGGYTGPHWNVICDVMPSMGNRLVYETYPGGIHSGADFYINSKGIMMGETTVSQTPFNPDGSTQSNRIRKAAQYANNIDDAAKILADGNNGMYTNDWLIADTKTDEIAIFLLGTYQTKMWRSSTGEFYGDRKDFYWSNNNNKCMDIRKEYIPHKENRPFDLAFSPWNRDIAFTKFYDDNKGKIDAIAGVNLWASTPINLPHACDGKITTSEMAENMVFLAHSGKVTLREKFVRETRWIPDKPGATPRLSLGYSIVSPVYVTNELKKIKNKKEKIKECAKRDYEIADVKDQFSYEEKKLWFNTVYPESEEVNWFVSGSTAYWDLLRHMPGNNEKAVEYVKEQLKDMNNRYLFVVKREGSMIPVEAEVVYDRYNNYIVPRVKGVYALHQLRLLLGNDTFSKAMNKIHDTYREKNISTSDVIDIFESVSGQDLDEFIGQWIEREDIPKVELNASSKPAGDKWIVKLNVKQKDNPYHFFSVVKINTDGKQDYRMVEVNGANCEVTFETASEPLSVEFNTLNDVPYEYENYYSFRSLYDEYHNALIVYGTSRQIEANNTLAHRFSTKMADRRLETLIPCKKDSEVTDEELANYDLIVLGGVEDNSFMKTIAEKLGLEFHKNYFTWRGKTYSNADDGIYATFANPYNPEKALYIFNANSALQLHEMTKQIYRNGVWNIFKGDKTKDSGVYCNKELKIEL